MIQCNNIKQMIIPLELGSIVLLCIVVGHIWVYAIRG